MNCVIIIFYIMLLYLCLNNEPSHKKRIKKTLVFGFAYGYSWEKISLFVLSLRKNGYTGDLTIALYNNISKIFLNELLKYSVIPLLIEQDYPFYSVSNKYYINFNFLNSCINNNRTYKYKWNIYRYLILKCWLIIYGRIYSHIISADVRDIVFQGNPFEWNFENGVYIAEETLNNIHINDSYINLKWIKVYVNYKSVVKNIILNSGIILGTYISLLSFLKQFCCFINKYYINTAEQATLNYLYYINYFKNINFRIIKNQKGIILTCLLDMNQIIKLKIKNSTIYNLDGTIPLIVHQYDRSALLTNMFKQKYLDPLYNS